MAVMDLTNKLVSISLFNKGQASRIFDRLRTQDEIIVLKKQSANRLYYFPKRI